MIKTIIFDFGGVLGTDADVIFTEVLEKHGVLHQDIENIWKQHWPKMKVDAEQTDAIWRTVDQDTSDDIQILKTECNGAVAVYAPMLALCQTIKKKGYTMGILANETRDWMDIKKTKGKLNDIFDLVYSSADIKCSKPTPESYTTILCDLHATPGETLFIDNTEKNIDAVKALGIHAIWFQDIEQLKKDLTTFNIL